MIWYVRPAGLVALARASSFAFVVPDRPPFELDGVDVEQLANVLAASALGISRAALAKLCDEATIEQLVELGVLESVTRAELTRRTPGRPTKKRCKRVCVAVTGSIRTASFLGNLVMLADAFAEEVDVIVTRGAARFVRPRVFRYYGMRVWTDPYAPAHGVAVPHKHLAEADLILVAPASATTIQRLATGACSDLTSLVVAITKAPVVVAPSMNPQMWRHPPIARNVAQLRRDGLWVIEPGVGFAVADRDEIGVGATTIEGVPLVRALDLVLTQSGLHSK